MRIALIGHGAIASFVSGNVSKTGNVELSAVLCRPGRENAARDSLPDAGRICTSAEDLLDLDVDLVLDCAGHAALRDHGPVLLSGGIDMATVSIGALSDPATVEMLTEAALKGRAQLELVPGAVGGLDLIAAAKVGGLKQVSYAGRKPPGGWKGTPADDVLDLDGLTEAAEHFRGSAREAAARYPKNANVAAAVALAGLGLDDTEVVLIADPGMTRNRHEISAEGAFGAFSITIDGLTLPGSPRTSALAAMSLVRAVERRLRPIIA
jgi:aspartate dehydrogenase